MNVLMPLVFLQMVSMIFGGPDQRSHGSNSRIARSPEGNFQMPTIVSNTCENDICEEVNDYPDAYIENIMSQSIKYQNYFALQEVGSSSISNRAGPVEVEKTLCTAVVRTWQPKLSKNFNGTMVPVVNTEKYRQLISTEICAPGEGKCQFADTFPIGYETGCKQKYTNIRMLAFDDSGPYFDLFPTPSCCVCVYKKTMF